MSGLERRTLLSPATNTNARGRGVLLFFFEVTTSIDTRDAVHYTSLLQKACKWQLPRQCLHTTMSCKMSLLRQMGQSKTAARMDDDVAQCVIELGLTVNTYNY